MKLAMLNVPGELSHAGLSGKMLLQVHDELVLECPEAELIATAALVRRVMENAYSLGNGTPQYVPLRSEARSGYNWFEMQLVGE
jgi:DNA polymerase-1